MRLSSHSKTMIVTDRQTDCRRDVQMDRQTCLSVSPTERQSVDSLIDARTGVQQNRQTDWQKDEQMDRWTDDRQMDKGTFRQMDRQTGADR